MLTEPALTQACFDAPTDQDLAMWLVLQFIGPPLAGNAWRGGERGSASADDDALSFGPRHQFVDFAAAPILEIRTCPGVVSSVYFSTMQIEAA
jgi:hypothetical protein